MGIGQKKGFRHSEETKRKIGEHSKKCWKNKDYIIKIEKARKERKKRLGYVNSPGTRKKLSNIMKEKIKCGEFNPRDISPYVKGHRKGMHGKRHSEDTLKKMSEKGKLRTGEMCSNWQGGKSFEPYDSNFNNKFKREIRKRDNQVCMMCGIHREKIEKAFCVHHINYDKKLTINENCISLCNDCHIKTNFNRNHWIKFFQDLLSERYCYRYNKNNEIIMEVKI